MPAKICLACRKIYSVSRHFGSCPHALELLRAYRKLHAKGGKRATISVLDKLVITLMYWREYRTYRHIAWDYGVSKSAIGKTVIWVEDTQIKSGLSALPSKRMLQKADSDIEIVLIDATEQPIERPKKGRKMVSRQEKMSHN